MMRRWELRWTTTAAFDLHRHTWRCLRHPTAASPMPCASAASSGCMRSVAAPIHQCLRGFTTTQRRLHVEGASRFTSQRSGGGQRQSTPSVSSIGSSNNGGGRGTKHQQRAQLPSFSELKRRVLAYLPFGWLANHAAGLFAYQMLIETMTTGCISTGLMNRTFTTEDVKAFLEAMHYPFMNLINFESGVHHDDMEVFGGAKLDAHSYSALHCGHNIAMGLMPLQIAFLCATYPMVLRVWPLIKGPIGKIPVVGYLFTPVAIPAEATGWLNRALGASLGGAAVAGDSATTTAAAGGKVKKPSTGGGASWRR